MEAPVRIPGSPAELNYWAEKAALLDPRCYEYIVGSDWQKTVPEGEAWYALNMWWLDAQPGAWWFHRPMNVEHALMLPAGTVLKPSTGVEGSYGLAYYARPKLVIDADPRYRISPRNLYFERLDRLRTLPLKFTTVSLPKDTPAWEYGGALFDWGDDDAQYGIIRHTSTHDVCWTIMVGGEMNGKMVAMNTLNEISDMHTIRFAQPTLCPFKRSLWNGIWAQSASAAGDGTSASTFEGRAVVSWSPLPADW